MSIKLQGHVQSLKPGAGRHPAGTVTARVCIEGGFEFEVQVNKTDAALYLPGTPITITICPLDLFPEA